MSPLTNVGIALYVTEKLGHKIALQNDPYFVTKDPESIRAAFLSWSEIAGRNASNSGMRELHWAFVYDRLLLDHQDKKYANQLLQLKIWQGIVKH